MLSVKPSAAPKQGRHRPRRACQCIVEHLNAHVHSARQPYETLRVEYFHGVHAGYGCQHSLKAMSAAIIDHAGNSKEHFVSFHFTIRTHAKLPGIRKQIDDRDDAICCLLKRFVAY
ncbi:MAG: hypothetical protein EPN74_09320 [Rhodanobacter sp.]|nr:MAG: hypothetical protein EPN74_09320 [Rhodanobacter sp.]